MTSTPSISLINNKSTIPQISFSSTPKSSIKTSQSKEDSFISRNKIPITIGTILASLTGFILLAKNGKLGTKCQDFMNKIFKFGSKNQDSKIDSKDIIDNKKNIDKFSNTVSEKTANKVGNKNDNIIEKQEINIDNSSTTLTDNTSNTIFNINETQTLNRRLKSPDGTITEWIYDSKTEKKLGKKMVDIYGNITECTYDPNTGIKLSEVVNFTDGKVESIKYTYNPNTGKKFGDVVNKNGYPLSSIESTYDINTGKKIKKLVKNINDGSLTEYYFDKNTGRTRYEIQKDGEGQIIQSIKYTRHSKKNVEIGKIKSASGKVIGSVENHYDLNTGDLLKKNIVYTSRNI